MTGPDHIPSFVTDDVSGWQPRGHAYHLRMQAEAASPEVLAEALGWLQDCFSDCPDELTSLELVRAVWRHWDPGEDRDVWASFVRAVE